MVPVNPATSLKAIQYIMDRVGGKPISVKELELGDQMAGVFNVLLGPAAAQHWESRLPSPPIEIPALPEQTEP